MRNAGADEHRGRLALPAAPECWGLIFLRFAEVRFAAQRAISKTEFDVLDQISLC